MILVDLFSEGIENRGTSMALKSKLSKVYIWVSRDELK